MDYTTPDLQEIRNYFFGGCSAGEAEKIEKWFCRYGKSAEATALLYALWNSLETGQSGKDMEDTRKAFDRFRTTLQDKAESRPKVRKAAIPTWIYKAAAALFIPLAGLSVWQTVRSSDESRYEWSEIRTAYGETRQVELSDGTSVWLNSGSSIIYPEKFSGRDRTVFFSGEAYFDVAGNRRKPFEIRTGESLVRVLGTEFNLKSYDEDNEIEVSLLDGKVVFVPEIGKSDCVSMFPGDALAFDKSDNVVSKSRFDVNGYSSWKDGKLYFKNCPLSDIVQQLERKFDVEIVIMTDSLRHIPYHMAFVNDENIDDILTVLDKDSRIRVEKKDGRIEIY